MKKLLTTFLAAAICMSAVPMVVSGAPDDYTRGNWVVTEDGTYTSPNMDFGNDFTLKHLGDSSAVSITATVDFSSGLEFGFMFGVSENNGIEGINEGGDQYYLVDFKTDGNPRVGIERNDGGWSGWKAQSRDLSGMVTLTVTYISGFFCVEADGEQILVWHDPNPMPGTGYGLIAKRCEATFKNVTVVEDPVAPAIGVGGVAEGDLYGDWTVDGDTYTLNITEGPNYGNEKFAAYVLGNTDQKVTLTADITASERNGWGGDSGFLFAVADANGDGQVKEGGDYYYLVEISCTEDHFIGIEKNIGGWGDWCARYNIEGMEAGKTYTFSATFDPADGTITVSLNGEVVMEYADPAPLKGTGYALASKTYGAVLANVSVVEGTDSEEDDDTLTRDDILSQNKDKNGVQFRENEDGTYDARLVIEAVSDLLTTYDSATLVVDFGMADGSTHTKSLEDQVVAYTSVTAGDELITADEGYALMGVIVTGVDYENILSVSATIILNLGEETTVIPIGTAIIVEA